jgi:hypothetical protein
MTIIQKRIFAFSIIPQYVIVKWLANYPELIETYYTGYIYQWISKLLHFIFGFVPFSFGDAFYTLAGIYLGRWIYLNRKKMIYGTMDWLQDVLIFISMLYFTFHLFWGMNYYRTPLHDTLKIENSYSTKSLKNLTNRLITKTNDLHSTISVSDTLKIVVPYSKSKLLTISEREFKNLKQINNQFTLAHPSVKLSLFSLPLTYMGFSGYLNPFTNEAQIDHLIPLYKYPTTIFHEKAHQLGYAAENEANFIGSLAAINSDDVYFKYSGYLFALRNCLNEIFKRDKDAYQVLLKKINKGILKNFQESHDFWKSYQNILEPLFKATYNSYLKVNNQEKGIESYSYAVALFVNYFDKKSL